MKCDWVVGGALALVLTGCGEAAGPAVETASDPAAAEAEMRRSWGGMLCVVEVEHSHADLALIQGQLTGPPGTIEVGSGNVDNQVDLTVFRDDGSYQRWADEEFGKGLVVVTSILHSVT